MITRLTSRTLSNLKGHAATPAYDRSLVMPGIVHIGVGGFHRAHEAVYLDDLLARGEANEWGICGVGLLPQDFAMRDALWGQDCLYTVTARDASGDDVRVVGSMVRYLFAPEEEQAFKEALVSPETRIISLTITEGGYAKYSPPKPRWNIFPFLAHALDQRRLAGLKSFTVLSCDNLPHNGNAAKRALLSHVSHEELRRWIEQNTAFPNSMVDRITPQTSEADRQRVIAETGLDDRWPVVCEPFKQWIIEDTFSDGRPALEEVGVQFVPDVAPYETMKLWLLNGSHSAMAYLGFLADFRTVPEVMADPQFRAFIKHLMDDEVTPQLPPVTGIDLLEYKATLLTRFDNPAIKDQITRLCLDGSSKLPKFLLPSLRRALETGRPHRLLTLALAGWLRYLAGTNESGQAYTIDDPRAAELTALAQKSGPDPGPLLALTDIFGDLGQSPEFVTALTADLASLYGEGARAAVGKLPGV